MATKRHQSAIPARDLPAVRGSTLPVNWEEELARDADFAVSAEKAIGGGSFISCKGGVWSFRGEVLDGPLKVIIVDAVAVNTYYTGKFNPDSPSTPVCFAIGRDPEKLAPTDDVTDKQSDNCESCWANAFRSAQDGGRGKACKNSRRIALVSADDLSKITAESEVALFNFPPTSLKYWAGYVKKLKNVLRRPPYGVVTELHIQPAGGAYVIVPRLADDPLVGVELLPAIKAIRETVEDELMRPFQARAADDGGSAQPRRAPARSARPAAQEKLAAAAKPGARPTAAGKKKF